MNLIIIIIRRNSGTVVVEKERLTSMKARQAKLLVQLSTVLYVRIIFINAIAQRHLVVPIFRNRQRIDRDTR